MFYRSINIRGSALSFLCALWLAPGCTAVDSKVPDSPPEEDVDAAPAVDAEPAYPLILDPISYVPVEHFYLGTGDLVVGDTPNSLGTIDTWAMTIDGVTYPEKEAPIAFDWWWVDALDLNTAPQLAVLHVRSFTIPEGSFVRALGQYRALVVLAETITIDGILDAGGHWQEPGPGGLGSMSGYELHSDYSSGARGTRTNSDLHEYDGGGGGGALASPGASGGSAVVAGAPGRGLGGSGGEPVDGSVLLTHLLSGSGGGTSSSHNAYSTSMTHCPAAKGGAGGGGVLLYARDSLRIGPEGGISVSGGGGQGGVAASCPPGGDTTGGGGGGSGGIVYLQSADIEIQGFLVANGGGGGGGAGAALGQSGHAGADGMFGTMPAPGGAPGGPGGSTGGRGGALGYYPHLQPDGAGQAAQTNAGGGGGSAGHLYIQVATGGVYEASNATSSPELQLGSYAPGIRQ